MAIYFSILTWRIPWTEEPGMLRSMGSQRERHDWVHMNTHEILSNLAQMRNTAKLWLGWGRFLFVIEDKAKGSRTISHLINQLENYRRIITFSKHKDCSNSMFSCRSKQTLTQVSLHKEMKYFMLKENHFEPKFCPMWLDTFVIMGFFFLFLICIYTAVPGLSCGMQDL